MESFNSYRQKIQDEVLQADHIAVLFDENLNYILVSRPACEQLKMKKEDLIGRNIIEMFPEIIASRNHRNLLKALTGIELINDLFESRSGEFFSCTYRPVIIDGRVSGILTKAIKLEMPESIDYPGEV